MALFVAGTFLVGCQKEEAWNFLDVSGDNTPSAKDIFAMKEAQKRADKYVTVENGKYKLSISSGSEIAISDRLFNMAVVRAVESSNAVIESGKMYIYDRALIEEGSEPILVTRINKWGVEDDNILEESIDRTWGYTSHTVRFNQAGAREYYNSNFGGSPSATFFFRSYSYWFRIHNLYDSGRYFGPMANNRCYIDTVYRRPCTRSVWKRPYIC